MSSSETWSPQASREQETRQYLALDLAALLQRLGITAVVRNVETLQALAYTDDALAIYGPNGSARVERATHTLCGVTFVIETPAAGVGHRPLDLTPRQATIVRMIAEGMRNRDIAERLEISQHTVRRHVEALLRRLNVPNRAAAAVLLQASLAPGGRGRRGLSRVA